MYDPIIKDLCAKAIGDFVMRYLDTLSREEIAALAERNAVALLGQIKEILDDPTLDDPACFQRIDAIVTAWWDAGLATKRHFEFE